MHQHLLWHTLRLIPGIGSKTLRTLVEHCGNIEAVWNADASTLAAIPGMGSKSIADFETGRKNLDPEREWEKLARHSIDILPFTDDRYPALLKQCPDAPALLYIRGNFNWQSPAPMIAVVGARKFTSYGEQACYRLATDLATAGYLVVSGLAFGIDSIAHKAALETNNETLAILGNGLDDKVIYPKNHIPLAHTIIQNGALVSEYPPGTEPNQGTFPARNRIMAGMSSGTLVIEAAERSGTLITAELALDYNREVFAVPGSIFSPVSVGTHRLIKQGAKIVTSVQDILEELPVPIRLDDTHRADGKQEKISRSPEEKKILSLLSHEPLHIDRIIIAARLETATVGSLLSLLELQGQVKNVGGMNYIRIN